MEINICKNTGNIWSCHPILWFQYTDKYSLNNPRYSTGILLNLRKTSQNIFTYIYIDVIPDLCPYFHAYYDTPFIVLHIRFVYSILYIHSMFILFYEPVAIQPVWSGPNLFDTVNIWIITYFFFSKMNITFSYNIA